MRMIKRKEKLKLVKFEKETYSISSLWLTHTVKEQKFVIKGRIKPTGTNLLVRYSVPSLSPDSVPGTVFVIVTFLLM